MLRKGSLIMISFAMLLSSFAGCAGKGSTQTPADNASLNTVQTAPAIQTTEPTEPDDGSVKFYYDDRISPVDLGGAENSVVQILEQEVESAKVGSSEPDDAVLALDEASGQLIAVGVGTATVDLDGAQVLIRVRPAPISLFMITGHSLGAGQCGVAAQSVCCEAGQAYSSHKTSTFQSASADMGIGYASTLRPEGIDAFAPGGGGSIGEGSGLAWKWNQLTGEKVWVLNAAVGGSVIPEWIKGEKYYEPAVAMYRAAAQVLTNEVAAGHYTLKNTAIIYHSAANFAYKNVEYTDQIMEFWYDSMVNGFLNDLSMDITGDGTPETVQAIGFLPNWSAGTRETYNYDKPINYYMALLDTYPGCFIAGETVRNWCSDSLLKENFPAIEYTTQSEPVEMPVGASELYVEDDVHFIQVVYNAAGLELGENLYGYFRTDAQLERFELIDYMGTDVKEELEFKRVGATCTLIAVTQPCYVSDFTVEHSDNLKLISPFTVKAVAAGEGYITISRNGQVVRHIRVTVGD